MAPSRCNQCARHFGSGIVTSDVAYQAFCATAAGVALVCSRHRVRPVTGTTFARGVGYAFDVAARRRGADRCDWHAESPLPVACSGTSWHFTMTGCMEVAGTRGRRSRHQAGRLSNFTSSSESAAATHTMQRPAEAISRTPPARARQFRRAAGGGARTDFPRPRGACRGIRARVGEEVVERVRSTRGRSKPTSNFGTRSYYNGQQRAPHAGVDFAGDDRHSCQSGKCRRRCRRSAMYFTGNTIVVDYGDRLFSIFAHLSEFHVEGGDTVGPTTSSACSVRPAASPDRIFTGVFV